MEQTLLIDFHNKGMQCGSLIFHFHLIPRFCLIRDTPLGNPPKLSYVDMLVFTSDSTTFSLLPFFCTQFGCKLPIYHLESRWCNSRVLVYHGLTTVKNCYTSQRVEHSWELSSERDPAVCNKCSLDPIP